MPTSRWDAEKIELMQEVHRWKERAITAETKLEALLQRQDEMAAQVEELRLQMLPELER